MCPTLISIPTFIYCGSWLNSFLHEAKDPHLTLTWAILGTHLRSRTRPSSHTPFSWTSLQKKGGSWFSLPSHFSFDYKNVAHLFLGQSPLVCLLLSFICCSATVTSNSVTPWTAAPQASLSFTISWSLLKLMSIELVMLSNYLILCPLSFISVLYY